MPGARLNDTERRLQEWWDAPNAAPFPLLRGVSVRGDPGLRGIRDLSIEFKYPVSVLCGRNGTGKSTILALAALAFHSPVGHFPLNAIRSPRFGENFTYYTFKDFFFRGPGDQNITGLELSWRYHDGTTVLVRKRAEKWMHYDRRPVRPVDYDGLQRTLPAFEQSVLRSHFPERRRTQAGDTLSVAYRDRLAEIMGRPYDTAAEFVSRQYAVYRAQSTGANYSSFNMGQGEDVLIGILLVLQQADEGTLYVIEEVEAGLHPEAQRRFVKHLLEIVAEKKLQVIMSSHSEHVIDALPRQARVLVQRMHDTHAIVEGVTTRFALSDMAGTPAPELTVYCEDYFAARLIEAALTDDLRRRCRVVPVGSNSELCKQVKIHRTHLQSNTLIVWDGDVSSNSVTNWKKNSQLQDVNWVRLPGGTPPETWAITTLNCPEGYGALSQQLRSSENSARGYIAQLLTAGNPHNIPFQLHQLCNLRSKEDAADALIRAVGDFASASLTPIADAVHAVLAGTGVDGQVEAAATDED